MACIHCIYLAEAMADACCGSQEIAQSVRRFWQDVVIRLWAWRARVKHREVPWVVQRIRICHAKASLHKVKEPLRACNIAAQSTGGFCKDFGSHTYGHYCLQLGKQECLVLVAW